MTETTSERHSKADAPAFYEDYAVRYSATDALDEQSAAYMVHMLTRDAVIIGCNPSFDTERLTPLLQRNGIEPAWHYRSLFVTTLAAGYLAGINDTARILGANASSDDMHDLTLPWSSDAISRAIDVDPGAYPRHTAAGDVAWCIAQYDTIMGTEATA